MKPFRFGLGTGHVDNARGFHEAVRRADQSGYDVLLIPDHLGVLSPETALMAAATRSDRLRIGSLVFNNDFRHPAVLAQQAATLDFLSDGRFELGLGAGWNVPEYEASGIAYDRAGVRIARMAESVEILKRLFAGETVDFAGDHYTITGHTLSPAPPQGAGMPILIGGNGDKVLRVAAQHASIIGLTGFRMVKGTPVLDSFSATRIAERIAFVRAAAGDRSEDLEFNSLVQRVIVTDERRAAAAPVVERIDQETFDLDAALDSPFMLFGTPSQIADQLRRYRNELGISYYEIRGDTDPAFDAVVEELAGT